MEKRTVLRASDQGQSVPVWTENANLVGFVL